MSKTLWEEVRPFFSYLLDRHRFRKTEGVYDPANFGDALMVIRSNELALRFVRDRGQVFVDIGPGFNGDDWHNLQYVLEFLASNGLPASPSSAWDLEKLGSELKAKYEGVRDIFQRGNYSSVKKDLKRFENAKSEEMIRSLLPSD